MSCACENKKLSKEHERMRRLAKATAILQETDVVLYKNADGTLGISTDLDTDRQILEYLSPY